MQMSDGVADDDDWESRANRVYAPSIRYRSLNTGGIDAAMDWRAELGVELEGGDWPSGDLIAGRVNFLTIRLHEFNVFEILDQFSDDAVAFAGLFEDGHLLPEFDDNPITYSTALILLDVYVAPPFRGRRLGAWMTCELIARMAPSIHAIVFAHPYPRSEGPFEESGLMVRRGDPAQNAVRILDARRPALHHTGLGARSRLRSLRRRPEGHQ